jgi:hypothetical protein
MGREERTVAEHRVGSRWSLFSIGSSGSILSIGSAGSILSIGSAGSILSIGSAGSVLAIGGRGRRGWERREVAAVSTAPDQAKRPDR